MATAWPLKGAAVGDLTLSEGNINNGSRKTMGDSKYHKVTSLNYEEGRGGLTFT